MLDQKMEARYQQYFVEYHSLRIMSAVLFFCLVAYTTLSAAWLPPKPIRGVNLGSLFVVEPWMLPRTWHSMGCGSTVSEWDCVEHLGQVKANKAFQKHWGTFITAVDFDEMKAYGLNTVRIPVGHWLVEETVGPGEQWPQGGMVFLDRVVEHAAVRDMHVIIDLHAAPGAQVSNNSFAGRVR
jgi:aryl-phospho-beta-D-glucosidase BglC (GH1 family)